MLYDPQEFLLILVDHGAAFATVGPGHIAHAEITAGKQWRAALRGLNDDALRAELGDVLDEQQLVELKQRRDALLNNSTADASD